MHVTEKLTKEVEYMNNRMKQKLLYQLGLIDDPWCIKDDDIIDDIVSENSTHSKDILKLRKAPSEFEWAENKWKRDKVYDPNKFVIKIKRSNSQEVVEHKKPKMFKR